MISYHVRTGMPDLLATTEEIRGRVFGVGPERDSESSLPTGVAAGDGASPNMADGGAPGTDAAASLAGVYGIDESDPAVQAQSETAATANRATVGGGSEAGGDADGGGDGDGDSADDPLEEGEGDPPAQHRHHRPAFW
jgi:hypothetical protein